MASSANSASLGASAPQRSGGSSAAPEQPAHRRAASGGLAMSSNSSFSWPGTPPPGEEPVLPAVAPPHAQVVNLRTGESASAGVYGVAQVQTQAEAVDPGNESDGAVSDVSDWTRGEAQEQAEETKEGAGRLRSWTEGSQEG